MPDLEYGKDKGLYETSDQTDPISEVFQQEAERVKHVWKESERWKDKGYAPVFDKEKLFENFGSLVGYDLDKDARDAPLMRQAMGLDPAPGDTAGGVVAQRLVDSNIVFDGSYFHAVEELIAKGDKQGLLSRAQRFAVLRDFLRKGMLEVDNYQRANPSVDPKVIHKMTRSKAKYAFLRAQRLLMDSYAVMVDERKEAQKGRPARENRASLGALLDKTKSAEVLRDFDGSYGFSSAPDFMTQSEDTHVIKGVLSPKFMTRYRREQAAEGKLKDTQSRHLALLGRIQDQSYLRAFGVQGTNLLHTATAKDWGRADMAKELDLPLADFNARLDEAHGKVTAEIIIEQKSHMEDDNEMYDLGVKDLDEHIQVVQDVVRRKRLKQINDEAVRAMGKEYQPVLKLFGADLNAAAALERVFTEYFPKMSKKEVEKLGDLSRLLNESPQLQKALQVALVQESKHNINAVAAQKVWPTIVKMLSGTINIGGEPVVMADEIGKYVVPFSGTEVMSFAMLMAYRAMLEDPKFLSNFRAFGEDSMEVARKKTMKKRLASVAFKMGEDYVNRYALGIGSARPRGQVEERFDLLDAGNTMLMFARRKSKAPTGGNLHNFHRYFFPVNHHGELDYTNPLPLIDQEFLSYEDAMKRGMTRPAHDFDEGPVQLDIEQFLIEYHKMSK